jgi:hypothetical protein
MNKKATIELQKIVAWALGALLALVVLFFIAQQLAPNAEGGLMRQALNALKGFS